MVIFMIIAERIKQVFDNKRENYKEFSNISNVKYRTLQTYLEGRMPSADFLIEFNRVWNVSIDWLLTGKGHMYVDPPYLQVVDAEVTQRIIDNQVKEQGTNPEYPTSARAQRLNVFINQYMTNHTPDEQAWFEIEFKKQFKDYGVWLDENTNK